jgi:hypothetical protein
MDEKLIKVLSEIAQDKEVVGVLVEALERGNLLERCPGTLRGSSRSLCPELCRKIWPDLFKGQCPCSKPNRLEIAQAIVALSKLKKEPEKTYRTGDIFQLDNVIFMLAVVSSGAPIAKITISGGGCNYLGDYYHDKPFVAAHGVNNITLKEIQNSIYAYKNLEYLGHISELTIKNGKVIK